MEWLCRWWIIQNSPVETAVRYYGDRDVMWTSQGMLRLSARAMRRLFQPTLEHIKQLIGNVLNESSLRGTQLLCQSWILCHKMLKIIIIIIIITRNTFCRTRSLSNATFFIFDHVTFIQFKICCRVQNFMKIQWFFYWDMAYWNCFTTIRDHPRSLCCWPQLPVKFYVNLIHRSEDIVIWIVRIFGLKCLFRPQNGGFGGVGPLNVIIHHRGPKRHILA